MKYFLGLVIMSCLIIGCQSSERAVKSSNDNVKLTEQDTVRISNDDVEYEVIIIEPGFNVWLMTTARPEGFYSQEYMENRNRQFVVEWNNRVMQPQRYNPNLYELRIDYDSFVDYGYEVNYKLYNYFIYFQLTYKQRLAGFVPRI